jgi:hypothetical protein
MESLLAEFTVEPAGTVVARRRPAHQSGLAAAELGV